MMNLSYQKSYILENENILREITRGLINEVFFTEKNLKGAKDKIL